MDKLIEIYNERFNGRMNKSTISRYENELQEPMVSVVKNFAEIFGVSTDYLMASDKKLPEGVVPYNPIVHQIPILGTISAGLPIYAEQNIEGYTYTEKNGGAEYFALRVKGDSMNAVPISEGSLVTIRHQEQVENGEIAAVLVNDDEATIKRFTRDGNIVQLIPQSYNPAHKIQIYDLKRDRIKIIGKVVECKLEF
jgi:repressor LexA